MSNIRGVRGAVTVKSNKKEEIISATKELLEEIVLVNGIKEEDIASIIFSATRDLDAEFPASAARELGIRTTPLLCATEIDVPGSLKKCIRILMHVNSDEDQSSMKHVYLGEAKKLREDLI